MGVLLKVKLILLDFHIFLESRYQVLLTVFSQK